MKQNIVEDLELYSYRKARITLLEIAQKDLDEIRSRDIKGISYDSIKAIGSVPDSIGNNLAKYEYIKGRIATELLFLKDRIMLIDTVMKLLDGIDSRIIYLKYIEKKDLSYISKELNYDRSSIYRREKKAINKISKHIEKMEKDYSKF